MSLSKKSSLAAILLGFCIPNAFAGPIDFDRSMPYSGENVEDTRGYLNPRVLGLPSIFTERHYLMSKGKVLKYLKESFDSIQEMPLGSGYSSLTAEAYDHAISNHRYIIDATNRIVGYILPDKPLIINKTHKDSPIPYIETFSQDHYIAAENLPAQTALVSYYREDNDFIERYVLFYVNGPLNNFLLKGRSLNVVYILLDSYYPKQFDAQFQNYQQQAVNNVLYQIKTISLEEIPL